MLKATKTLTLIESCIEADSGAKFRTALKTLLPKMEDAYRGEDNPFRSHLGASVIGKVCPRELFYSWRWVGVPFFPARIQRLFNRGHLEEARCISLFQMIGCEVWFETDEGGQFRLSEFNGHFGSALDSVIKGCPDVPDGVPAYGEYKTHNDKNFKKLVKDGVKETKFQHYVQMQMCMKHFNLKYGIYFAVNKNDDDLHAEIIEYDDMQGTRYLERAENIIFSDKPLPRISSDASWFECKFCDHTSICHGNELPRINCRTCFNGSPQRDGTWLCAQGKDEIKTKDTATRGCDQHVFNPHLINGVEILDANILENWVTVKIPGDMEETWSPNMLTSMQLVMRGLE
jgi:hypothetical protein